jgi:ABC-type dipeptide/oligopeptide/nickel transport system permease subunit
MSISPDRTIVETSIEELPAPAIPPSRAVWRALFRNPTAVVSVGVLLTIILAAVFVPVISPYNYAFQTNDISAGPSQRHWLGTDDSGYDIAVRLAVGGRISLFIGIGVETVCLLVGITIGLMAGYYGKWADTLLMRFTDMMFAFPDILLAILIMSVVSPGRLGVVAGLGAIFATLVVTGWPSLARLVRGQTLVVKSREFVEAARAIGAPSGQIMFKHILPNLLSPIVVAATIDIAGIVVAESTLSFLGLGIQPPLPSWGTLISYPLESGYWTQYPGLVLYPAIALTLTVLSFNFLGDALREALDPRSGE